MTMNRRNVLIGLGAVAAGGGAVIGSGAFSQVEADRTMTVSFANDGSAQLGLTVENASYASYGSGNGTNGANTLQLTFDNVNDNAVSQFAAVFGIANNDPENNSHDVYVQNSAPVDGTVIDFRTTVSDPSTSIVGSANAVTLADNTVSTTVGVYIDSTNAISSPVTVTIVAN